MIVTINQHQVYFIPIPFSCLDYNLKFIFMIFYFFDEGTFNFISPSLISYYFFCFLNKWLTWIELKRNPGFTYNINYHQNSDYTAELAVIKIA